MSEFKSNLVVKELDDNSNDGRGTWQLVEPLIYLSDIVKILITVPIDFITDFASVPRVPIAFLLDGDRGHPAAVIHDFLYTYHDFDKATCDKIFREALVCCDVPNLCVYSMYIAVSTFGQSHYDELGQVQPQSVINWIDKRKVGNA